MPGWLTWLADPLERGGATYWLWEHMPVLWAMLCPIGALVGWWSLRGQNWAGQMLGALSGAFAVFIGVSILAMWFIAIPVFGVATLIAWLMKRAIEG
jgi:membrane protein YdbS with pleckstrin-like domain